MSDEKYPLVLVTWRDAHFTTDYDPHDDGLFLVETMGALLRKDDDSLWVASERLAGDEWRDVTCIPRAIVLSIEPLVRRI
jgi:hypothetical protein